MISFPPITNSEDTKIEPDTTSLLVEVTSSTKLADAKNAADALIQEMLNGELGKKSEGGDAAAPPPTGKQIVIEQVKIVDADGHHKVTYPSKTDVQFERAGLVINRP